MNDMTTDDDADSYFRRTARLETVAPEVAPRGGYQAVVSVYQSEDARITGIPDVRKTFAFVKLTPAVADHIEGDLPDVDGTPVMHIGSDFGKWYYTSNSRTVPVDVLERLRDADITLVRGVDGGWERWERRPEWSDTRVDLTDVEVVDMDAEIGERRVDGEEPETDADPDDDE